VQQHKQQFLEATTARLLDKRPVALASAHQVKTASEERQLAALVLQEKPLQQEALFAQDALLAIIQHQAQVVAQLLPLDATFLIMTKQRHFLLALVTTTQTLLKTQTRTLLALLAHIQLEELQVAQIAPLDTMVAQAP